MSRGGPFYAFAKENTEIRAGTLSQLGRLSHIGREEGEVERPLENYSGWSQNPVHSFFSHLGIRLSKF